MKQKKEKDIELFEMWLGCGLYVQNFVLIKIESSLFLKQANPYNLKVTYLFALMR